MGTYAAKTDVSSSKSRDEIERILGRYGADEFGYVTGNGGAQILFSANGRRVRFTLPLPDRNDPQFTRTPTGKTATESSAASAWEQAIRQKWRALALVVKAKLEAIESGISEFEQEFGMHIVLPSGRTVYDEVRGPIEQAYLTGAPGPLLQIEG